jgi:endonuclease/exonuclease/phosphatase family metal-dependent hydrolase
MGSSWRGLPSKGGVAFEEALAVQKADWARLREAHPNEELFVMGDFNQDLVGSRYYGSVKNRKNLEAALNETGLVALTGGDMDPVYRESAPCACIDHVCARADSKWRVMSTERWPDAEKPVRNISDHFGIAVELAQ